MAEIAVLPTTTAKVLVVDDEPSITDAVATALRYEGFETMEVGAGRAAELAIDEFRPDLIVLDVMLPDLDGFAIARRLRDGNHRVPVIFLTAKDATEDKVAGLALADDYVTKPFSLAEIVARVQTVLRRTRGDVEGPMRFADLTLDEETREVRRGGREVVGAAGGAAARPQVPPGHVHPPVLRAAGVIHVDRGRRCRPAARLGEDRASERHRRASRGIEHGDI